MRRKSLISPISKLIATSHSAPIDKVSTNIHLFSGKRGFDEVDTCFVGMMAVPDGNTNGQDEALYNEANCIFKHNLRQRCATINYGYIDVQKRCLVFDGAPQEWHYDWYASVDHRHGLLSLSRYLELLINAQGATLCDSEEEADVILVMTRATNEKEVSLIDENFFME